MGKSLEPFLRTEIGNLHRGAANHGESVIRERIGQSIDTTLS